VVYEVELVELRYVVVVGAYVDSVGRGYEQVGGVGQHGQGTTVAGAGTRIQGSFTTDEGMSMLCGMSKGSFRLYLFPHETMNRLATFA
jgi:hypothetical protein